MEQSKGRISVTAEEMAFLSACDKPMRDAVQTHGRLSRAFTPDIFTALVHAIIGQQISTAAHQTVWKRFCECFPRVDPVVLREVSAEEIQAFGMTMRKAAYIKNAADMVFTGALDIAALETLEDDAAIAQLIRLNGVGVWTAEMLLLFTMARPNILSYGDLAIRNGLMKMHGLQALDKRQFAAFKQRYTPHGSAASLYIWAQSATLEGKE